MFCVSFAFVSLFLVYESYVSAKKRERSREKEKKNMPWRRIRFELLKSARFVKSEIGNSKVVKYLLPFSPISFLLLCIFSIILSMFCLECVSRREVIFSLSPSSSSSFSSPSMSR